MSRTRDGACPCTHIAKLVTSTKREWKTEMDEVTTHQAKAKEEEEEEVEVKRYSNTKTSWQSVFACTRVWKRAKEEKKKNQLTFRRYCEILSPCSQGMTQPFDVLQSNARPLLLLVVVTLPLVPLTLPVLMPFPFTLKWLPYG